MERVVREWKDDIRDILRRIHDAFIQMITEYTRKFFNSLLKIECSEKMAPFYGEDKRQRIRLDYMREKFIKITEIID